MATSPSSRARSSLQLSKCRVDCDGVLQPAQSRAIPQGRTSSATVLCPQLAACGMLRRRLAPHLDENGTAHVQILVIREIAPQGTAHISGSKRVRVQQSLHSLKSNAQLALPELRHLVLDQ